MTGHETLETAAATRLTGRRPPSRDRRISVPMPGIGERHVWVPFTSRLSDDAMVEIDHDGTEFIVVQVVVGRSAYFDSGPANSQRIDSESLVRAAGALTSERVGDMILQAIAWDSLEAGAEVEDFRRAMASVRAQVAQGSVAALAARAAAGSKYSKVTLQDLELVAKIVRAREPNERPYAAVMNMPDRRIGRARAYQLINQAVERGFLTKEDLK